FHVTGVQTCALPIYFTPSEIDKIKAGAKHAALPYQESGTKPSNAICYELYVQEKHDNGKLELRFEASKKLFGEKSLAGAFNVYDLLQKKDRKSTRLNSSHVKISYAV